MELVGADRKLLKAFYTQYTAVLLIILTFTIGAFQRTLAHEKAPVTVPVWAPRSLIGEVKLLKVFTSDGSLVAQPDQLAAIAEVLTQHDLIARVTVSVGELGLTEGAASLRRARVRLQAIKNFMLTKGVPHHALLLVIKNSGVAADSAEIQLIEGEG
jgi:hypothetical protein